MLPFVAFLLLFAFSRASMELLPSDCVSKIASFIDTANHFQNFATTNRMFHDAAQDATRDQIQELNRTILTEVGSCDVDDVDCTWPNKVSAIVKRLMREKAYIKEIPGLLNSIRINFKEDDNRRPWRRVQLLLRPPAQKDIESLFSAMQFPNLARYLGSQQRRDGALFLGTYNWGTADTLLLTVVGMSAHMYPYKELLWHRVTGIAVDMIDGSYAVLTARMQSNRSALHALTDSAICERSLRPFNATSKRSLMDLGLLFWDQSYIDNMRSTALQQLNGSVIYPQDLASDLDPSGTFELVLLEQLLGAYDDATNDIDIKFGMTDPRSYNDEDSGHSNGWLLFVTVHCFKSFTWRTHMGGMPFSDWFGTTDDCFDVLRHPAFANVCPPGVCSQLIKQINDSELEKAAKVDGSANVFFTLKKFRNRALTAEKGRFLDCIANLTL